MGWLSKATGKIKSGFSKFKGTSIGAGVGTLLGGSPFSLPGMLGMEYGSQYDMMRAQNEMQNKMIEKQNQLNMDMWNLQNSYNSPAAQMQRYIDAGLNPNLIYGSVSNGNASSAPEMTATGGSNSALALASIVNQATGDANKFMKGIASRMLGNIIDDMDLNLMQKEANVENTKAQTKALSSVKTQTTGSTGYNPKSSFGRAVEDAKHYMHELDDYLAERNMYRDVPLSGKEKDNYYRMEYKFIHGELPKERFYAFLDRQRKIDDVHDRYASYLERKYASW